MFNRAVDAANQRSANEESVSFSDEAFSQNVTAQKPLQPYCYKRECNSQTGDIRCGVEDLIDEGLSEPVEPQKQGPQD